MHLPSTSGEAVSNWDVFWSMVAFGAGLGAIAVILGVVFLAGLFVVALIATWEK